LAVLIMKQQEQNPAQKAEEFLNENVETVDEALAGASDIIAEWISEDENARRRMRRLYEKEAMIFSKVVKGKEAEGIKFSDYFDWSEPLKNVPHTGF